MLDNATWRPAATWDLWLGYLSIAEARLLIALLNWLQERRCRGTPAKTSSSSALATSSGSKKTAQPTIAAPPAVALPPGWAMDVAPAANPADEGAHATPALIGAVGYAGPPALPAGSRLNVPADGLCLSYSLLSARDVNRLRATPRDVFGFVTDSTARDFRRGARAFRERACERGLLQSGAEQAEQIMAGVFPEGAALHWFAAEAGGSVLVTVEYWGNEQFLFGEGPIIAHICNHLQIGPDGNAAPHYLLLQSYMRQPRRGRRDTSSSSSSSSSCS